MHINVTKNNENIAKLYSEKNKFFLTNFNTDTTNGITTYFESLRSDSHILLSNSKEILRINRYTGQIDQLTDDGIYVSKFPDSLFSIYNTDGHDDNNVIVSLIQERLQLGRTRYGHGVNINHDTRQFGTHDNSWESMLLEEALDGMIYAAAAILRYKNSKRP